MRCADLTGEHDRVVEVEVRHFAVEAEAAPTAASSVVVVVLVVVVQYVGVVAPAIAAAAVVVVAIAHLGAHGGRHAKQAEEQRCDHSEGKGDSQRHSTAGWACGSNRDGFGRSLGFRRPWGFSRHGLVSFCASVGGEPGWLEGRKTDHKQGFGWCPFSFRNPVSLL